MPSAGKVFQRSSAQGRKFAHTRPQSIRRIKAITLKQNATKHFHKQRESTAWLFQEQSQAPPPFPKAKHAWAHPLVSSCNHLLLQVLLQQVIQEKEISKKNILKSSIPVLTLILPKYFPRGFAKGTWSSGKWQVVPTREFTYPKFSQMFPKTFFSGNIFFLISGEC